MVISSYFQSHLLGKLGVALTCEIHFEKGNPRSRENAQSSRDTVAKVVTLPLKIKRKRTIVSNNATPTEPVFVNKNRYGALVLRTSFKLPMQKSIAKMELASSKLGSRRRDRLIKMMNPSTALIT